MAPFTGELPCCFPTSKPALFPSSKALPELKPELTTAKPPLMLVKTLHTPAGQLMPTHNFTWPDTHVPCTTAAGTPDMPPCTATVSGPVLICQPFVPVHYHPLLIAAAPQRHTFLIITSSSCTARSRNVTLMLGALLSPQRPLLPPLLLPPRQPAPPDSLSLLLPPRHHQQQLRQLQQAA